MRVRMRVHVRAWLGGMQRGSFAVSSLVHSYFSSIQQLFQGTAVLGPPWQTQCKGWGAGDGGGPKVAETALRNHGYRQTSASQRVIVEEVPR